MKKLYESSYINVQWFKGDDLMKLKKGLVQIYTGDGKGKTTAAIGQGIRSAGYGLNVVMVQFLKGGYTGELSTIDKINNFNIFRFEKERDFVWNLSKAEIEELKKEIRTGYEFIKKIVDEGSCDVLIIDEIMGAHYNKFISTDEIIYLIKNKKESMEIVLTGRNVPMEVIDLADLVTEMKMIKHPFEKGIGAREGIEY